MSKEQDNATHSLAHTKWNCKYHIVFAPKYRRKVFYVEKREAMEYPLTDAGNAERLHEIFGKKWVYMPGFRKWMQWNGHCLQAVKAETLYRAAAEAFENLAADICHLPATADPMEQKQRLAVVNWLLRSRVNYHTKSAVRLLKKLKTAA